MACSPLMETDRPFPAGGTDQMISKLHMAALFNSPAAKFTDARTAGSWPSCSYPSQYEAKPSEKDEEGLNARLSDDSSIVIPLYSLTYGRLTCSSSRSRTSPLSTTSSSCTTRTYRNQLSPSLNSRTSFSSPTPVSVQMVDEPTVHPSDHMKSLLSLIASSISTFKTAFSLMRASSVPLPSAEDSFSSAEKAISAELQTLSGLHMRLYSLAQQHDLGPKQKYLSHAPTDESMPANTEKKDTMLKSYERIITRFHDEIRQKDATTEALKQILARLMLKGEKLTARIKHLEAKDSSMQ